MQKSYTITYDVRSSQLTIEHNVHLSNSIQQVVFPSNQETLNAIFCNNKSHQEYSDNHYNHLLRISNSPNLENSHNNTKNVKTEKDFKSVTQRFADVFLQSIYEYGISLSIPMIEFENYILVQSAQEYEDLSDYFNELMTYLQWGHKNIAGYLNSQYFRIQFLEKADNLDEDEKEIISKNLSISFFKKLNKNLNKGQGRTCFKSQKEEKQQLFNEEVDITDKCQKKIKFI